MATPTRTALIGVGWMARYHIPRILKGRSATVFPVVCEPSERMYAEAVKVFNELGLTPPPNQPDLKALLRDYGSELDVAFIVTPHVYHHDQTQACLEAGLDVLLEKPMVMNTKEARSLIEIRDRTGKLLVVGFPGSLSPQIRMAARMMKAGEFGRLHTVSGVVWEGWGPKNVGTWRQRPEVAGGGFLFDTGAHVLNTVVDMAGEDVVEVAAWLENNGRPVDTLAAVMARLKSGALVTFNACGETIPSCSSDLRFFCEKAIVHTGMWGERLEVQYDSSQAPAPIPVPDSLGVWEEFLDVRAGRMANPSPPELGLRNAALWEAIQASTQQGGRPVKV